MAFCILSLVSLLIGVGVSLVAFEGVFHIGFTIFATVITFIISLMVYLWIVAGFDYTRSLDIFQVLGLQKVQSFISKGHPKFYAIVKKCWHGIVVVCFAFGLPFAFMLGSLVFAPITKIQCSKSTSLCEITTNLFFTETTAISSNTDISVHKHTLYRKIPIIYYNFKIGNLRIDYDIESRSAQEVSTQLTHYIQQQDTNSFTKFHVPRFWIYYFIGWGIFLLIYREYYLYILWGMCVLSPFFMSWYSFILERFLS